MKTSTPLLWLSALIVVLALMAASVGLFWSGGDGPFTFTTLRGAQVEIYDCSHLAQMSERLNVA